MAASDGAVSRQSRTGPLLSAAAQDRPVCRHVWDGPVPSPVTPGAAAAASLARLPHPRHVVSSLVVSQSPRLQERLAAALSLSRRSRRRQHLPASGCCPQLPCSSEQPFPCHSGSHGREISIQTEGGRASGQPPPVFSGAEKRSLWGGQVPRPEPSPPPGGWDGVLGTQKRQQPALVPSHWVLGLTRWPPPSSATLCCPLVCFRVAQCLVVVYVERQARRGRGKEGRDSSC